MASVEDQPKRPTQSESAFINFCSSIATGQASQPYWLNNIKQFEKVFVNFKNRGKSHLPITIFVDKHRSTLEAPLMSGDEPNDQWLSISDDTPVPVAKSLMPVEPRGVYLPMKDWEKGYVQSLPLAEVYAGCLEIAQSDRKQFAGVTVETLPAKFLLLFFQMLSEAEPENKFFQTNAEMADMMVIETGSDGMMSALGSMASPENMEKIGKAITPLMDLIPSDLKEAATKTAQTGDMSALFSAIGPMLGNLQAMFAGAQSEGASAAAPQIDSVPHEGAEDQE